MQHTALLYCTGGQTAHDNIVNCCCLYGIGIEKCNAVCSLEHPNIKEFILKKIYIYIYMNCSRLDHEAGGNDKL